MKTGTFLAAALFCLQLFGQTGENFMRPEKVTFGNESSSENYYEFLKNQNDEFEENNVETFLLDGTIWYRLKGEKEYCLTPNMDDVTAYEKRITSKDNMNTGVVKSNFQFVRVKVADLGRNLLSQVNISVPDYVKNEVICYLPEIDIDRLFESGIELNYLDNYGSQSLNDTKDEDPAANQKVLIWSDGFESTSSTVPGTNYNAQNGSVNCGWQDVDCYSHSGNWAVWCAGGGPACDNCGEDYQNDMETNFYNSSYINVSGYEDIVFSYWIDLDLNNTGTNDEFRRYEDLGIGSWSLAFTATSANQWDGELWEQGAANYTGDSFTEYGFLFEFSSNSFGTSYGVYIDDLQLSGNASVGVEEGQKISDVKLFPNPSEGLFTLELNSSIGENPEIAITDLSGKLIYKKQLKNAHNNQEVQIDLSSFSKGIYTLQLESNENTIRRKLVIQ